MPSLPASIIVALLLVLSPVSSASAAPSIAMHGEAKYKPGFSHFDYVNPDAPKGGTLRLAQMGTFDLKHLNPDRSHKSLL